MRRDMKHKIVERPRFNGYGNGDAMRRLRRTGKNIDPENADDQPTKVGMRAPHIMNWSGKELNENLNPLYRYLNKQAGRKWDDVYSEICEQIRPDSATQLHVLQHVDDLVEQNVKIVDGVPCYGHRAYWSHSDGDLPIEGYRNGSFRYMYVDPRDGILKFAPDRAPYKFRKKEDPDVIWDEKDEYKQYRRIKGIWYEIEFRDIEDHEIVRSEVKGIRGGRSFYYRSKSIAFDLLFPEMNEIHEIKMKYDGRLIVPIKKRQLNKREIKRLAA